MEQNRPYRGPFVAVLLLSLALSLQAQGVAVPSESPLTALRELGAAANAPVEAIEQSLSRLDKEKERKSGPEAPSGDRWAGMNGYEGPFSILMLQDLAHGTVNLVLEDERTQDAFSLVTESAYGYRNLFAYPHRPILSVPVFVKAIPADADTWQVSFRRSSDNYWGPSAPLITMRRIPGPARGVKRAKVEAVSPVFVDYGRSVEEMTRTGYDWKHPEINSRNFPPLSAASRWLELWSVSFEGPVESEEILREFERLALRPATAAEVLAYAAVHPDQALNVVAFGSVWDSPEAGRRVPWVQTEKGTLKRDLGLAGFDGRWVCDCRFAGVPK